MVADESMLAVLHERDGKPTRAILRDGRSLIVYNIAWGYDIGDDWAHITSNISPSLEDVAVDFFYTSDVVQLDDVDTGDVLFRGQ